MTRQKLLTEPQAPTFWAILDEAALRRRYGSARVMREQLEHLVALGELPTVTLQVLRFDAAASAATGPFTVLRFAEPDLPDIVYIEQLTSAVYLDKQTDVVHYRAAMDRIAGAAACPAESAALLTRLAASL
jgi:hypothetical protein